MCSCMVNVLPTNTCEGAIRTVSCGHCSFLTGTFIEHSIIIITAVSKSTDVRSLCALIDIWLLNGMSVATNSNNSISYTNACESAICISPCNHCSILTSTFIKCSTIFNTAVAKPTDGRILCTFIDIWLKKKESRSIHMCKNILWYRVNCLHATTFSCMHACASYSLSEQMLTAARLD